MTMCSFEIPHAPPFGKDEELEMIEQFRKIRSKVFKGGERLKADDDDVAEYENERHEFALRYSFITLEASRKFSNQCRRGMTYEDLFNTGFGAILCAIDRWFCLEDEGHRFLSYIKKSVNNAIYRFLDNHNRIIRVPSYKIEQLTTKVEAGNKAIDTFGDDIIGMSMMDVAITTGRFSDVANLLDLDISTLMSVVYPTVSLDTPIGEDGFIIDLICEESKSSKNDHKREVLEKALGFIDDRFADVIRDHFFNNMSLSEIAKKNNYSKVRASQMVKKSIRRLSECEETISYIKDNIGEDNG